MLVARTICLNVKVQIAVVCPVRFHGLARSRKEGA